MSRNLSTTSPVARKPHRCDYCELPVAVGKTHVRCDGVFDGTFYTLRLHTACADLARGWGKDEWFNVDAAEFRRLLADRRPSELLTGDLSPDSTI